MAGIISNDGTNVSEMGSKYKILSINDAAIAGATDTLTLTQNENGGIGTIVGVIATIADGISANFQTLTATFSGLVVTIKSYKATGAAADTWSSTTANILIIGY